MAGANWEAAVYVPQTFTDVIRFFIFIHITCCSYHVRRLMDFLPTGWSRWRWTTLPIRSWPSPVSLRSRSDSLRWEIWVWFLSHSISFYQVSLKVLQFDDLWLVFLLQDNQYPFLGTLLDTRENLERKTSNLLALIKAAGEVAGQMALRLVHDHLLRLNTEKYLKLMYVKVNKINKEVIILQRVSLTELHCMKDRWCLKSQEIYRYYREGLIW